MQKDYQPDGAYIPRLLYAQPDGTLRPDIKNPKALEKYGYFYSDASQVRPLLTLPSLTLICSGRLLSKILEANIGISSPVVISATVPFGQLSQ